MSVDRRIGFMQGRLSPMVDGRIQSFPWQFWRDEFAIASRDGFTMMEWTLDQDRLHGNPLMTNSGQGEIRDLCRVNGFSIPSLTGDCFMQAPFWKARGERATALEKDFEAIASACSQTGVSMIVVPLVDNGRLESQEQEDRLIGFLEAHAQHFAAGDLRVLFESDFPPDELARFIGRLDPARFGINYDIGNSAALGYLPVDEFAAYGDRVLNVHVKDRVRGGTTVPLGSGDADFDGVFEQLALIRYGGNFILQTARATDGDHATPLRRYRDMTLEWLHQHDLAPAA